MASIILDGQLRCDLYTWSRRFRSPLHEHGVVRLDQKLYKAERNLSATTDRQTDSFLRIAHHEYHDVQLALSNHLQSMYDLRLLGIIFRGEDL
jgi:hypothetical protein